jgi:UDP-N-acetyl-D-mannosaminuronic acid dehydrogenase
VTDPRLTTQEAVLERSDILVLGAPHRAYRTLDLSGREVVDIWNATGQGIRL